MANASEQLRWLRWVVGGVVGAAFAFGQLIETLFFDPQSSAMRLLADVLGWGLLGGLAAWCSLTWASRIERRYQQGVEVSLREQQALNQQLQRSNSQLALLSEVNRQIADSTLLDEVLDAALAFPQRLVPAQAAALLLLDANRPLETRAEGASAAQLARLRMAFGIVPALANQRPPRQLVLDAPLDGMVACLLLPLHDGFAPVGWIELYRAQPGVIDPDELELLETIASEIAEAVVGARRRSREERAVYELERAIAEERARIARDIHDGIAQSLAFVRMRVDLWRAWVASDPGRLDAELTELKATLREQIRELRRAIFALRPVQFDELGFVGGLHRYVVEFANQHGWEAHVDLSGAPADLSPEVEAASFRIVQEALTNIAKHAGASRVSVQIDQAEQGLRLIVSDNGCGFDPGAEVGAGHVGLRQMRERLLGLRGTLTISAQPGAGSQVEAWIPL